MAQLLQQDAQRAAERRAQLLEATSDTRPAAHVNPAPPVRKPGLLRRIFRPSAEPAPSRLD
jgi:hypothetical protein